MTTSVRWLIVAQLDASNALERNDEFEVKGLSQEMIMSEGEVAPYDPSAIESIILNSLNEARSRVAEISSFGFRVKNMQLSIRPLLFGDGRPAFYLSAESVKELSAMGLSLDFDPY